MTYNSRRIEYYRIRETIIPTRTFREESDAQHCLAARRERFTKFGLPNDLAEVLVADQTLASHTENPAS